MKVLVIAPPGELRNHLCALMAERGCAPVALGRREVFDEGQLVVTERDLLWHGVSLLEGTDGAVVLDSGYMWPQPVLAPSAQEWERYRENLDEYLRNERESASLWYSTLGILNFDLPVCINPQSAFEAAAFKPAAFDALRASGVAVAPYVCSNDSEEVAAFMGRGGPTFAVVPDGDGAVTPLSALPDDLTSRPAFLVKTDSTDIVRVVAVDGEIVHGPPDPPVPAIDTLRGIHDALAMPLAGLTFSLAGVPVLVDFTPSPDLSMLGEGELGTIAGLLVDRIGRAR